MTLFVVHLLWTEIVFTDTKSTARARWWRKKERSRNGVMARNCWVIDSERIWNGISIQSITLHLLKYSSIYSQLFGVALDGKQWAQIASSLHCTAHYICRTQSRQTSSELNHAAHFNLTKRCNGAHSLAYFKQI